jgi:class 3 adenylate cyclase/glyoxylase-like metal-dependent hydrolase (beta-lactamase superfamily II)
MKKLDDANPVEIAENIWWVGFADYEAGFSNNPYLLVEDEEAVLFDPGPGHPLFRDLIMQKIQQITAPERIRYIVAHHQDPDLCGLIPFIENILHPDVIILAHPRASVFIPYYGTRKGMLPIGDGDTLELKSGRRITFYHAPYLHFAGNMMSYDEQTCSLFSGDVFAVFSRDWKLYADDSYIELGRNFIKHYIASKEPLQYAYDKISKLKIERILPQHGGIIKDNVDGFLNMLIDVEPGHLLEELKIKPSREQEEILFETGVSWLRLWLKKEIDADSLDALMDVAMAEGPSTVALLIDNISAKASELGVANPLTHSRLHRWDTIWSSEATRIMDSVRKRYLTRQYGMQYGGKTDTSEVLEQGFQAFKAKVAIMFIDIRGFTQWSADRSPDEVMGMLDRELELMARSINSRGGRVNKIMGDGMLAYFPEHMISEFVPAAIEMLQAVEQGNMLPIGVGGDFGEAIMGDIGQEVRLDYTLIGSIVNFAKRMCDTAKGGEIAITDRLSAMLDDRSKSAIAASYSSEDIKVKVKPSDPEVGGVLLIPQNAKQ